MIVGSFTRHQAGEIYGAIARRENLVMRCLDRSLTNKDMFDLMYPEHLHEVMREVCAKQSGNLVFNFAIDGMLPTRVQLQLDSRNACSTGYPTPILFDRSHWPENAGNAAAVNKIKDITALMRRTRADWQSVRDVFELLNASGIARRDLCNFWPALPKLMGWSDDNDLRAMAAAFVWSPPRNYNKLPPGASVDLRKTDAIVGVTVFLDPDTDIPNVPVRVAG